MNRLQQTVLAMAAAAVLSGPAMAQKGIGDPTGVAREAVKPPVVSMSGTVAKVNVGACEQRGEPAPIGAHLFVDTGSGPQVNLHLGPLSAVEELLQQVPEGAAISFEAFRTDTMPANAYVAKSVTAAGNTTQLRDDSLRPSWAGGPGRGAGMGRGPGAGGGQGRGISPCWW